MSISARIEYVQAHELLDEPIPSRERPRAISRGRRAAGLALAVIGLPLLTLALHAADTDLEAGLGLFLLAVVTVALVGGAIVAVPTAVAAALLMNYFFVEPLHTLDVERSDQAIALVAFVVVAAVVSGAMELAERRALIAERAAEEAETLSGLAGSDLDGAGTLHSILDRMRRTFDMESVTLLARDRAADDWHPADHAGWAPPGSEAAPRFDLPIGTDLRLIGRGPALFAEDQRVLKAFAAAAETAYEGARLGEQARSARRLADADRQRTALLAAVGHDLRTPLAGIKAAVSSLRQGDVRWSPQERDELLETVERSADRLGAVISNLLDASRLQAGALAVHARPVALDEVVGAALLAVAGAEVVEVDVPEDLPLVLADPGLLERVLANLIDNALRHGGANVRVSATAGAESAKLVVADDGPGVPEAERQRLFEAFSGAGEGGQGVGLGLTVARGFTEAMGGRLAADASGARGLTMRLRIPLATGAPAGTVP